MRRTLVNLTVNTALLLAALVMMFSGLLIQIKYHMEGHGVINTHKTVMGLVYFVWSGIHTISSVLVSVFMVFHITRHWKWYKTIVRKKLFRKNKQVLILTLVFTSVAISGFIPLIIKLSSGDQILRKTCIEIHDKLALILSVYLILHISKRLKWYFITFNKIKRQKLKHNAQIVNRNYAI